MSLYALLPQIVLKKIYIYHIISKVLSFIDNKFFTKANAVTLSFLMKSRVINRVKAKE